MKNVDVTINHDKGNPIDITFTPVSKDMPTISYNLVYPYELYYKQLYTLTELLDAWIKTEKALHKKLDFASESQFLNLFKNINIISLPSNLKKLEDACIQRPYNSYPRFINFLSHIQITLDPMFLDAVAGRFFYHLISLKDPNNCTWTYDDLYRLVYYYNWVYLYSVYQSINNSIPTENN